MMPDNPGFKLALHGPGTMIVHTGGELFEFPTEGEPLGAK